ncbi:orf105a (mitochondrion) [Beta vulgaris subsp. vulgaris]|uniref:Orf105a protein n=3 Tax=Beta TaxID=3554 RepID=Q9MFE5_BETVV|nr:orf105a [Beta vulgaris subsp. vulgaris]YP_004222241.1 hypothetical protein LKY74_mgp002 [Beta vulgaris subsp. maritima]YP_004842091.1 hypothetical protein LKY79_mgp117 [Beta macrocarpa]CBJ14026.1 hypothetical protein [Beta vulgaris subsp. maritima]CBJ17484.1 hypothetical protein [Beta vulgaris subsp. maritima]CBL52007.1 hypothetical protein [Beta vulgaris subsp. maritima]CBX24893.1 hypothetical protein [Beta macrocarpa]BAA99297.1 orf105a [Beta vulgaris subsp. vulgaris]
MRKCWVCSGSTCLPSIQRSWLYACDGSGMALGLWKRGNRPSSEKNRASLWPPPTAPPVPSKTRIEESVDSFYQIEISVCRRKVVCFNVWSSSPLFGFLCCVCMNT